MTIEILITCDECGTELKLPANKPEAIDIYQRSGGVVSAFTGAANCSKCAAELRRNVGLPVAAPRPGEIPLNS